MTLNIELPAVSCEEAYVTLVTSDSYVVGALVLGHSLRRVGTTRRLVCMVTPCLAYDSVASLREVWEIKTVAPLDSGDICNLQLLGRPELGPTFTKIRLLTPSTSFLAILVIFFTKIVDDYIYHADRMMRQLKRSGKPDDLKGLIIGKFSGMKDTDIPFGQSIENEIQDLVKGRLPGLFWLSGEPR